MSTNPFDFIKSINSHKYILTDNLSESEYNPFIVNLGFSLFADTIFHANEMNLRPHLTNKMQYDFYFNAVRPRKRFRKWPKKDKVNSENILLLQELYKYNTHKAKEALSVLTSEQIELLHKNNNKGGT